MRSRTARWSGCVAGWTVLAVAVAGAIAGDGESRLSGPVFELWDPAREVRETVDANLREDLARYLNRVTRTGASPEATAVDAVSAASDWLGSTLGETPAIGRDSGPGELIVLAVLQEVVARHPELEFELLRGGWSRPSPIERFCDCDRRGSEACGCRVENRGPGTCQYRVSCRRLAQSLCSAVNVELCVLEAVLGTLAVGSRR